MELKFVLNNSAALKRQLIRQIEDMAPLEYYSVQTQDTYFKTKHSPGYIYRLREDERLCQLTVKSTKFVNAARYEVNLDVSSKNAPVVKAVAAFLKPLEIMWEGKIRKKVAVFLFRDCEIVYYIAKYGRKAVCCLEIEATKYKNLREATKIIAKYCDILGLAKSAAVTKSLFDILVGDSHVSSRKNSRRS
ncbi:MAG: CYTH domain-containing protein [Oligoflexales bacterium]